MKKKVKELTIQDVKWICKKHPQCRNCPLKSIGWLCLGLKNMDSGTMNKVVEINETKDNRL